MALLTRMSRLPCFLAVRSSSDKLGLLVDLRRPPMAPALLPAAFDPGFHDFVERLFCGGRRSPRLPPRKRSAVAALDTGTTTGHKRKSFPFQDACSAALSP